MTTKKAAAAAPTITPPPVPHAVLLWTSSSAGVAMATIPCASREAAEAAGLAAVEAMAGHLLGQIRYTVVAQA